MKCPQCGKEQPDSNLLCANPACSVDFQVLARRKQERAEAAAAKALAETEEKEAAAAASSRRRNVAKDLAILAALVLAGLSLAVGAGYYSALKDNELAAYQPRAEAAYNAAEVVDSTPTAVSGQASEPEPGH